VAGVEGSGNEIEIPNTQEALLCWGYMEALQDLSALVDQNGTRCWAFVLLNRGGYSTSFARSWPTPIRTR
jgi:hypothetical protein